MRVFYFLLAVVFLASLTACRAAQKPASATAAIQINAIPWGTVKSVASSDGRMTLAVNAQTPLCVKVPPGEYSIVIFGPKGQEQMPTVNATDTNPGKYMAAFEPVDVLQIIKASTGSNSPDPSEASPLAAGIRAFYGANFVDAESSLLQYLAGNAPGRGLGEFYLGASELTRYYLAAENGGDQSLQALAQDAFRQARQEPGFMPPERYVSPKIMAAFENARK
jgi:hypothetical protein